MGLANTLPQVTIYSDDRGPELLLDPASTSRSVSRLIFSTTLPGGFTEASFTLSGPSLNGLMIRPGLAVAITHGRSTLWWGWIEDIKAQIRGTLQVLSVTCLGPWQELEQRLMTGTFTGIESTSLLLNTLRTYAPHISQDTSRVLSAGVPLTYSVVRRKLSDLVRAMCDAGSASGNPLLFRIEEPPRTSGRLSAASNLIADPTLEQRTAYWYLTNGTYADWSTVDSHSPTTSMLFQQYAVDGLALLAKVPVLGSTNYSVDFWHRWSAHSSMTIESRVDWFDSGDLLISSTYGGAFTSDGLNTTWTQRRNTHLSPANAVTARPFIGVTIGTGAGRGTYVDDVYFYRAAGNLNDPLPRVRIWEKNPGGFDYLVYTANLSEGWSETRTTRSLANSITVGYSSSSVTGTASDAQSIARYRQRDLHVTVSSGSLAVAEGVRNTLLAARKDPSFQPESTLVPYGSLFSSINAPVNPFLLRAGDRLKVMDGPNQGKTVMLTSVSYRDGQVSVRPESYRELSVLLARG